MNRLIPIPRTFLRCGRHGGRRIPFRNLTITRFYSSPTSTSQTNTENAESDENTENAENAESSEGPPSIQIDDGEEYPDLSYADPMLDLHESITFPATKQFPHPAKVTVFNDPSL